MRYCLFVLCLILGMNSAWAQAGIGTSSPDPSSILELQSSDRGLLLPRLTDTTAVSSPAEGLMIYDSTDDCLRVYANGEWSQCFSKLGIYETNGTFTGNRVVDAADFNLYIQNANVLSLSGDVTSLESTVNGFYINSNTEIGIVALTSININAASTHFQSGSVGIGASPNASSILELSSTDKGLLLPRLADTTAISSPVEGLMIYDNTDDCLRVYANGEWSQCFSKLGIYESDGSLIGNRVIDGANFDLTIQNTDDLSLSAADSIIINASKVVDITATDSISLNATVTNFETGNVGIGTSPTQKLDIDGRIRVRSIDNAGTEMDALVVDANGLVKKRDIAPKIAQVYNATGNTTFSSNVTWTNINFGVDDMVDTDAYTTGTSSIQVLQEGVYRITYRVSFAVSGSARTQSKYRFTVNGAEVDGTYTFCYHRNNSTGTTTSATAVKVVALAQNDIVRVQGIRDSSGSNTFVSEPEGCSLLIEWIE